VPSVASPAFTRQHFVLIAETISNITDPVARHQAALLFATRLGMTNPAFQRGRFLEACDATNAEAIQQAVQQARDAAMTALADKAAATAVSAVIRLT